MGGGPGFDRTASAPVGAENRGRTGCTLPPIAVGRVAADTCLMIQLAIRCHPRVPVSAEELERWLEQQVDRLRAEAPRGTVRLSRLTQELPSVDIDIGWLLELELPEGEPLLARDRLTDALRDMRLLGLEPTLLAPQELSDWAAQRGDGTGEPTGSASAASDAAPGANGTP
jgi:hypothetical protein